MEVTPLPRLRLTGKLVITVACISLLAVGVAGVAYRLVSGPAFQDLIVSEGAERFTGNVTLYYRESGKVAGIKQWLAPRVNEPPASNPADPNENPEKPVRPGDPIPGGLVHFGLADPDGLVVLQGRSDYPEGQVVPASELKKGRPIFVDGKQIGTILVPTTIPHTRSQDAYISRIGIALAAAAGIGVLLAVVAGLLVARGIVRPIQRLTAAAHDLAGGRLGQQIPIQGQDELSDLTASFNHMSADVARYEQARRQMAADIAHELRSPLTTISGYIEAMRDGDLAPTFDRLDSVYLQTHRLARVIEDLRLLSVAEVGGLRLERAPISMRELILQTVRMHEVNASRKQVDLRTDVDQALPEVEVDPGRIQQVIDILVNNALRHTDSGHVAVSAGLEDGGAVIRVADTGSGIAPELLPRLFDRFYRGEDAQGRDRGGSGLGLAIAQAIVKAHHGTIAVSSELGKGSVFSIRLPLGMDPAGSWARAGEAIAATLSGGSFEPTAVAP